jgi:hypothetical protein
MEIHIYTLFILKYKYYFIVSSHVVVSKKDQANIFVLLNDSIIILRFYTIISI